MVTCDSCEKELNREEVIDSNRQAINLDNKLYYLCKDCWDKIHEFQNIIGEKRNVVFERFLGELLINKTKDYNIYALYKKLINQLEEKKETSSFKFINTLKERLRKLTK